MYKQELTIFKNNDRSIEAQIVPKLKNNKLRPKFTGSYKKKRVDQYGHGKFCRNLDIVSSLGRWKGGRVGLTQLAFPLCLHNPVLFEEDSALADLASPVWPASAWVSQVSILCTNEQPTSRNIWVHT